MMSTRGVCYRCRTDFDMDIIQWRSSCLWVQILQAEKDPHCTWFNYKLQNYFLNDACKIRCLIQTNEISKLDLLVFYKETRLQPIMPRTKSSFCFLFIVLSFLQNESCCCFASDHFHVKMNVVFLQRSQFNVLSLFILTCGTFWLRDYPKSATVMI